MGFDIRHPGIQNAIRNGLISADTIRAEVKPEDFATEAEFQTAVIERARSLGWKVAHFRPARTADGGWVTPVSADGKGFPDLIMVRGKRIIAAELKFGYNKPTPEQLDWLAKFAAAGGMTFVWYPCDWAEIVSVLSSLD